MEFEHVQIVGDRVGPHSIEVWDRRLSRQYCRLLVPFDSAVSEEHCLPVRFRFHKLSDLQLRIVEFPLGSCTRASLVATEGTRRFEVTFQCRRDRSGRAWCGKSVRELAQPAASLRRFAKSHSR